MGLAPRPLQGESHLVEEPLTLSHAEGDGVVLFEMVRQQKAIPQVLVVAQFPGGAPYFRSQSFLVRRRKPAGTSRVIPFTQSGKATGEESLDPIFDSSGRVSVQARRVVGTGSAEDGEDHVKPVKISPFLGSRYFILNGRNECFGIRNRFPFQWEHLLHRFCSHYILVAHHAQLVMA